jgi:hypothetical protein
MVGVISACTAGSNNARNKLEFSNGYPCPRVEKCEYTELQYTPIHATADPERNWLQTCIKLVKEIDKHSNDDLEGVETLHKN